jgi:heptosyltransferase-1
MAAHEVLVVRLGAMGDILHTLPAVAGLKRGMPEARITWVVEPRWRPLLENNPHVADIIAFDRAKPAEAWRALRARRFDRAVDFQGLIKSAAIARLAHSGVVYGFATGSVREFPAQWFYSTRVRSHAVHVVDCAVDLAVAAGGSRAAAEFPIPPGSPEGRLPVEDFVLASPLAGWGAKQWPLEYYSALAIKLKRECGLKLVLNGPREIGAPETESHVSGIAGLIDATRRATAVIGLDSGPLHLATSLDKSGVALYGPTDPARNGPYGGRFVVLRAPFAVTSHKRRGEPDASMRAISPDDVFRALAPILAAAVRR